MKDDTVDKLHNLSQEITIAMQDVLEKHSTMNEYHDLLALASFFFRFKRAAIFSMKRKENPFEDEDFDIEENVERILLSLEYDLNQMIEEEMSFITTNGSSNDEYGPN